MDYKEFFKRYRYIINLWINSCRIFFFVLLPLNTSFDLIDSYGETICHKSAVKVRVVMSVCFPCRKFGSLSDDTIPK